MPKYGNQKTEVDGIMFDSKKEANRYAELKLMQRAGLISDLAIQYPIVLLPEQRGEDGKVIERPVRYIADFSYTEGGRHILEDAKGVRTKEYILKRKLALYFHGIRIREV